MTLASVICCGQSLTVELVLIQFGLRMVIKPFDFSAESILI